MAEGILRAKLKEHNIPAEVDSAGLEAFHIGDSPDKRAILTSNSHGIDISSHRARLVTEKDFDRFDKIYVMDSYHFYQLLSLARTDKDMEKIDYTMNVLYPGKNIPVQDPWYDGMNAFEKVFEQLDKACEKIVKILYEQNIMQS